MRQTLRRIGDFLLIIVLWALPIQVGIVSMVELLYKDIFRISCFVLCWEVCPLWECPLSELGFTVQYNAGADLGFRKGGFQNVRAQARGIFFRVPHPLLDTPTKYTIMKFCSAADVCAPKTIWTFHPPSLPHTTPPPSPSPTPCLPC